MELLTLEELWGIFEMEPGAFIDNMLPGICKIDWLLTESIVSKMQNMGSGSRNVVEKMQLQSFQQTL